MKKNVKIRTPEKIKTDVNIVSFCIHALRFIPGNFVFFITRVWWLAFLMFACSAVTLYFAEQMSVCSIIILGKSFFPLVMKGIKHYDIFLVSVR